MKEHIKKMWTAFSNENINKSQNLELHYSKQEQTQRERCDLCHARVAYIENKLL